MSPRDSLPIPTDDSFVSTESHDIITRKPKVHFGSIHVREFNRIVGDHPDVRVGPPISIGWEYTEQEAVLVNDYEINRDPCRRRAMRLTSISRRNILEQVGVSQEEIRSAEAEIRRIRQRREHSTKQDKAVAAVESTVKRVGRKIRKNIVKSLKASSSGLMTPMYMM